MSVQKVQKSTKIQVHNIGDVDEMMLQLYFESKRSGGGDVADIQVFPQDDYAIIEFSECASKSHMKRQTADMSNSTHCHDDIFKTNVVLVVNGYFILSNVFK